jgi:hypothetical protein
VICFSMEYIRCPAPLVLFDNLHMEIFLCASPRLQRFIFFTVEPRHFRFLSGSSL